MVYHFLCCPKKKKKKYKANITNTITINHLNSAVSSVLLNY